MEVTFCLWRTTEQLDPLILLHWEEPQMLSAQVLQHRTQARRWRRVQGKGVSAHARTPRDGTTGSKKILLRGLLLSRMLVLEVNFSYLNSFYMLIIIINKNPVSAAINKNNGK